MRKSKRDQPKRPILSRVGIGKLLYSIRIFGLRFVFFFYIGGYAHARLRYIYIFRPRANGKFIFLIQMMFIRYFMAKNHFKTPPKALSLLVLKVQAILGLNF